MNKKRTLYNEERSKSALLRVVLSLGMVDSSGNEQSMRYDSNSQHGALSGGMDVNVEVPDWFEGSDRSAKPIASARFRGCIPMVDMDHYSSDRHALDFISTRPEPSNTSDQSVVYATLFLPDTLVDKGQKVPIHIFTYVNLIPYQNPFGKKRHTIEALYRAAMPILNALKATNAQNNKKLFQRQDLDLIAWRECTGAELPEGHLNCFSDTKAAKTLRKDATMHLTPEMVANTFTSPNSPQPFSEGFRAGSPLMMVHNPAFDGSEWRSFFVDPVILNLIRDLDKSANGLQALGNEFIKTMTTYLDDYKLINEKIAKKKREKKSNKGNKKKLKSISTVLSHHRQKLDRLTSSMNDSMTHLSASFKRFRDVIVTSVAALFPPGDVSRCAFCALCGSDAMKNLAPPSPSEVDRNREGYTVSTIPLCQLGTQSAVLLDDWPSGLQSGWISRIPQPYLLNVKPSTLVNQKVYPEKYGQNHAIDRLLIAGREPGFEDDGIEDEVDVELEGEFEDPAEGDTRGGVDAPMLDSLMTRLRDAMLEYSSGEYYTAGAADSVIQDDPALEMLVTHDMELIAKYKERYTELKIFEQKVEKLRLRMLEAVRDLKWDMLSLLSDVPQYATLPSTKLGRFRHTWNTTLNESGVSANQRAIGLRVQCLPRAFGEELSKVLLTTASAGGTFIDKAQRFWDALFESKGNPTKDVFGRMVDDPVSPSAVFAKVARSLTWTREKISGRSLEQLKRHERKPPRNDVGQERRDEDDVTIAGLFSKLNFQLFECPCSLSDDSTWGKKFSHVAVFWYPGGVTDKDSVELHGTDFVGPRILWTPLDDSVVEALSGKFPSYMSIAVPHPSVQYQREIEDLWRLVSEMSYHELNTDCVEITESIVLLRDKMMELRKRKNKKKLTSVDRFLHRAANDMDDLYENCEPLVQCSKTSSEDRVENYLRFSSFLRSGLTAKSHFSFNGPTILETPNKFGASVLSVNSIFCIDTASGKPLSVVAGSGRSSHNSLIPWDSKEKYHGQSCDLGSIVMKSPQYCSKTEGIQQAMGMIRLTRRYDTSSINLPLTLNLPSKWSASDVGLAVACTSIVSNKLKLAFSAVQENTLSSNTNDTHQNKCAIDLEELRREAVLTKISYRDPYGDDFIVLFDAPFDRSYYKPSVWVYTRPSGANFWRLAPELYRSDGLGHVRNQKIVDLLDGYLTRVNRTDGRTYAHAETIDRGDEMMTVDMFLVSMLHCDVTPLIQRRRKEEEEEAKKNKRSGISEKVDLKKQKSSTNGSNKKKPSPVPEPIQIAAIEVFRHDGREKETIGRLLQVAFSNAAWNPGHDKNFFESYEWRKLMMCCVLDYIKTTQFKREWLQRKGIKLDENSVELELGSSDAFRTILQSNSSGRMNPELLRSIEADSTGNAETSFGELARKNVFNLDHN
eukprot:GHVH01017461.1.p1 GENE.GHVH01017461.1~~GHVH01017461.1.p1  ORF type:complete len:1413 (+),score=239.37 GHVH01017461.1:108-4346(+)